MEPVSTDLATPQKVDVQKLIALAQQVISAVDSVKSAHDQLAPVDTTTNSATGKISVNHPWAWAIGGIAGLYFIYRFLK